MANETVQVTLTVVDEISNEIKAIRANMESNFAQARASAEKTQGAFRQLGNEVRGNLKQGFEQLAASMIAFASITAVIKFLKDSTQAATEAAQAQARLSTALGHTSVLLNEQANALQKTTLFMDDEVTSMQAVLAGYVKNENAVRDLTPAVLDLATATGQDLNSAAMQVAKGIADDSGELGRYKIAVEGAAGSTERIRSVVSGLSENFGGQATAAYQASNGMHAFAVAVDEFNEGAGGQINDLIRELSYSLNSLGTDFNELGSDIVTGVLSPFKVLSGLLISIVADMAAIVSFVPGMEKSMNFAMALRDEAIGSFREAVYGTSGSAPQSVGTTRSPDNPRGGTPKKTSGNSIPAGFIVGGIYSTPNQLESPDYKMALDAQIAAKKVADESMLNQNKLFVEASNATITDMFDSQLAQLGQWYDASIATAETNSALKTIIDEAYKTKYQSIETARFEFSKKKAAEELIRTKADRDQKIRIAQEIAQGSMQTLAMIAEASGASANTKKKIAQGEAIINGALGITKIWAEYGSNPVLAGIFTAIVAAQTAAQVAIIEKQKFAMGGIVQGAYGPSDSVPISASGGEMVLTRRQQAEMYRSLNGGGSSPITVHLYDNSGNLTESIAAELRTGSGESLIQHLRERI
jgi:uncharacterized protein YukE